MSLHLSFLRRPAAAAVTSLFLFPLTAAAVDSVCRLDTAAPLTAPSSLSIDLPASGDPAGHVVSAVNPPDGPIGDPVPGSLSVSAALLDRPHYRAGDVITLDIQTGVERAQVAVDFSAVDSAYRSGSESVSDLGRGRYRVTYRPDSRNTRLAGVYPLTAEVRADGRAERREIVSVTWLPRGRARLEAPSGRFLAGASRISQASQGVATLSAARFEPAGSDEIGRNPQALGTLRLTLASAAPLRPGEADLEIVEQGRDGHLQVPLAPEPAACTSTGCLASATVALERGGAAAGAFQSSLSLRLTQGGTASAQVFLPGLDFKTLPFNHTHRVSGQLRFRFMQRFPDILASVNNPDFPQYASVAESVEERPIASARIVLQDECGHYITGSAMSDGTYSFEWTPVGCGQGTLTVWSVVQKGVLSAAVGKWRHGTIDALNELTTATADYIAYSYTQPFDTDDAAKNLGGLDLDVEVPHTNVAAKAFFLLDRAITAQLYYRDIPGVGSLPKLNIIYTPGAKPLGAPADWDGQWATYLSSKHPGMIWIPADPDYGWNSFAMLHETGHYFHRHYLRDWNYGRLSEPLANAQATAIAGSPWFDKISKMESIDAQPNYKNNAFRGAEWQMCNGCNEIDHSYGWEQRVFWDLYDGTEAAIPEPIHTWIPEGGVAAEDFPSIDLFNGGGEPSSTDADDHVINDVLIDYVGGGPNGDESGDYVDRGIDEVDLVDILDGMLCRGHATETQIDTLVNDAMGFGYDFGGPASCL